MGGRKYLFHTKDNQHRVFASQSALLLRTYVDILTRLLVYSYGIQKVKAKGKSNEQGHRLHQGQHARPGK